MCAYVLCQMDYSSPVFPVMDGPLWTLRKCSKFTWVYLFVCMFMDICCHFGSQLYRYSMLNLR